jgi:Skp family chaperone for outer membrane proteins
VEHGRAQSALLGAPVAVVDLKKCFASIEEYQNIAREGLDERRARYHFYLRKANQKFSTAVQTVARLKGIVLVVEKGGVTGGKPGQIVDLTDQVVDYLERY